MSDAGAVDASEVATSCPTRDEDGGRASIFSGHLSVRAEARLGGATAIAEQSFRAPFHLSKPYWDGRTLLLQVVNPTAGVLRGDRLTSAVAVGPNAALLLTTPSATRIFRMEGGTAESVQRFDVEAGGWLEVWPEPLVPHREANFSQRTEIDIAPGAALFFADILLPGRVARGEAWAWRRLVLDLRVRVGGVLTLRERLDQTGEAMRALAALAGTSDAAAFGNIVVAGAALDGDDAWKRDLAQLHRERIWIGVSRLRSAASAYSIKLIAPTAEALRRAHRDVRRTLQPLFPHLACDPRKL